MNPLPLTDPQGRIYTYACGMCNRIHASSSRGSGQEGDPPAGPTDEALLEHHRDMAADCCKCRRCGKVATWISSECRACAEAWRAAWEADAPVREAAWARIDEIKEAALAKATDRDAATALRELMSEISETYYCAGWIHDLEFDLWRMLQGGCDRHFGMGAVTADEIAELRRFSEKCGGWWRFIDGQGETFITLDEWAPLYAAQVAEWEARSAHE